MKILNIVSKIIFIFLSIILLYSCKSADPCPDEPASGNLGNIFNSDNNEYAPVFYDDKLYITTLRDEFRDSEAIYYSQLSNNQFTALRFDTTLPINNIKNAGLPSFHYNKVSGNTELYFAAPDTKSNNNNRNIFYSKQINNKWTEPISIENINTEYYESYPFISKNGKYLLFVSDRAGAIGEIDIYISKRNENGTWSEAINLGNEINTKNIELSPFLDEMNNLYYSSKGFTAEGDFEIIKAKPLSEFRWNDPQMLDYPINTKYNETGPFIYKGKIYFTSNRDEGCGGEDIYAFDYCGPVYVNGQIIRENSTIPISGNINLFDASGNIKDNKIINESGNFKFKLNAMENYLLEYKNDCFPEFTTTKELIAPCSDSSSVKMTFNFILPDMQREFDFAEYDIPFFVTGYYYPNTKDNLQNLKLKFAYNLFTDAPETKYIENPNENYYEYTDLVENALDDAYMFILDILKSFNSKCATKNLTSINILVEGYSDPRKISESALYSDEAIYDENMNIFVENGSKMDNKLLSELRAYYTAKHIQEKLKRQSDYKKFEKIIKWNIDGKGIDESKIENKYKRRVKIIIQVN